MKNYRPILAIAIVFVSCCYLPHQAFAIKPDSLLDMDIEALMAVTVTSALKYEQSLFNTPVAMTVISSQDISNSGTNEIPELLRLVPGMMVIRESEAIFAVSARSIPFEGQKKMLVLADNRSIFSQDTGTVIWESQNFSFDDIERIEVIRGPGGTSWGYNSVNGVVNIISKKVKDTQGLFTHINTGYDGNRLFQARFGDKLNDNMFYKIYYSGSEVNGYKTPGTDPDAEGINKNKYGFRLDFEPSSYTNQVSIEGAYSNSVHKTGLSGDNEYNEAFIKGEWSYTLAENVNFKLLSHYDTSRQSYLINEGENAFEIGIKLFNTEAQLDFFPADRHHFIIGAGFKLTKFNPSDGYMIVFKESDVKWKNFSVSISDEFSMIEEKLWLTMGVKMEYNNNTGYGWQPNVRMLFKPTQNQSVWASISKALRPADFRNSADRTMMSRYPDGMGGVITFYDIFDGTNLKDEDILSFEAGYRIQMKKNLSGDAAFFYNENKNILSTAWEMIDPRHYRIYNIYKEEFVTYGAEFSSSWQPLPSLQLKGSYTYLVTDHDHYITGSKTRETAHIQQFQIQAHLDVNDKTSFNALLFWNNSSEMEGLKMKRVLKLDLGVTHKVSDNIEIALHGQNLLDHDYSELHDTWYRYKSCEIARNISFSIKAVF